MDEYESMKETIEVLSNVDVMEQLEEGKKVLTLEILKCWLKNLGFRTHLYAGFITSTRC